MTDDTRLIPHLHDPAALTRALIDIESVSGNEHDIANAVEATLRYISDHGVELEILRDGDTLVARTHGHTGRRVVIAGHVDTVPVENNVPSTQSGDIIYGRGACDMKAGLAMMLYVANALTEPQCDITWVFYDHEEVEAHLNGLGRVTRNHPEWVDGDFAILGEPSNSAIEGGCNGTIRVEVVARGVRAHSARAFVGDNAIHKMAPALELLAGFEAPTVPVDGLDYRESLSAVGIRGGVAGNVVPDECVLTVNYRFAPSKTVDDAYAFLAEFFHDYTVTLTDAAPGARPGLGQPMAEDFVAAVGVPPNAKLGWTDVSRFSDVGIPAVNFGPGNPLFAHRADEQVPVGDIVRAVEILQEFLEPGSTAGTASAARSTR